MGSSASKRRRNLELVGYGPTRKDALLALEYSLYYFHQAHLFIDDFGIYVTVQPKSPTDKGECRAYIRTETKNNIYRCGFWDYDL